MILYVALLQIFLAIATNDFNLENYSNLCSILIYNRSDDKLDLRHELEGHQLGVVSVDMNHSGTCIF